MTRAVNAAARFIHISGNESLSNAFQAGFALIGNSSWRDDHSFAAGNVALRREACFADGYLLGSDSFSKAQAGGMKPADADSDRQCSGQSILPFTTRPIELEELSEAFKAVSSKTVDSETVNSETVNFKEISRTPYRSREFKRTDAVPV